MQIDPTGAAMPRRTIPPDEARLRKTAEALETNFLAEMLKHAGLGEAGAEGFDGGEGAQQFASFLREEQARAITAKGGIGLAEQIFESLRKAADHG